MKKILLILIFLIPIIANSQTIIWEMIEPIGAQVEKTNPVGNDLILIQDSESGTDKKYIKFSTFPTKATNIEVLTGLNDTKYLTPAANRFVDALTNVPFEGAMYDVKLGINSLWARTVTTDTLFVGSDTITNNLLVDYDSTGFRVTQPQVIGLADSLAVKLPINNPTATGILTTPDLTLSGVGFDNGGYVLKTAADGSVYAEALTASQVYKGKWDASTNTPTLANGAGTAGWYYRVTVAGTVDFGGGNITFIVGDDVYYNGTVWEQIPAPEITGNALSKVDDTNVTLTLGGSPLTSLLQATSLTLGWTGTLADNRIASSTLWNNTRDSAIVSLAFSGTTTKTLTLTQRGAGTISNTFTVSKSDVGLGSVENAAASGLYEPILTTGNLTESITGLQFDQTRQVIGGAAALSLTSGYFIPTTADSTLWNNTADSIPVLRADINANLADYFEKELIDSENNIGIGFNLENESIVFLNGASVPKTNWSGVGSQILNLSMETKLYDNLIIRK